ncbi:MAG: hypothetical protein HQ530_04680 [Parcubacteria group bacterium]|nr:hypothetical protein [Parcubacteria group bacterium]
MKTSIKKGLGFGLASGVITTLGLMVGLSSSTQSVIAVIGGVVIIALADGMSDALGIHISEEAENAHSGREIWESTLATLFSKIIVALSFVVPVLIFPLSVAIIVSIGWGLLLIAAFSYYTAQQDQHSSSPRVIIEHLAIAGLVIVASHYVGELVYSLTH